jgi:ABC-type multidrug transport system fused ATPase/permease subunit
MLSYLNEILEKKEKKYFIIIALMMVIVGLLEVISLGILVPFISFLVNPEIVTTSNYVIKYAPIIVSLDNYSLLILSLGFILITFASKSLYMTWFHYKKNNFIYKISDNITYKIFSNHIARPYSYNLENNSSNFILDCINEVTVFVDGVLLAGLEFVSEMVLIFFIVSLLFIINPTISLFTFFTGTLLFLIFQSFTKSRLKKWSFIRQTSEQQMLEKVQQGFNGIKEIKIFLKELFFIESYMQAAKMRSTVITKYQTLIDIPKVILELVAIIVFVFMIYLILGTNQNIQYFVPIIGLYVAASFKLLPALNRIIVSAQRIKRSSSSIIRIRIQLKDYQKNIKIINEILKQNAVTPLKFEKNIVLTNICFKYPDKKNFVFKDLNLNIKKGEIIGIIGKSGEGKSTLVNILSGFIVPTQGTICVDDTNIQKNLRGWQSILSYIPQTAYLFNDTIYNNICFYSNISETEEKKFREVVEISQLKSFLEEIPLNKETIVGERGALLSGGQSQRIVIARNIYKDPQVMILDEATSSLDFENEKKILRTIQSFVGKKTIIIVSHKENTLSFCDKVYKVQNGKCTEVNIKKV